MNVNEERFSGEIDYNSDLNLSDDEIEDDDEETNTPTQTMEQFDQGQFDNVNGVMVPRPIDIPFEGFTHTLPGMESIVKQEGIVPPIQTRQMTPADIRLFVANLVIQYGAPKDENVTIRFIVGRNEINKNPGRGPGEIDVIPGVKKGVSVTDNPNKRNWTQLKDFSKRYNWRHILSDDFQGDYKYREGTPFVLDGQEWKTVTHYLLGMLYSGTPAYSILYSVESRENQNGFWGDVRAAEREHFNNTRSGLYPIDLDFPQKIEGYLKKAYLAKFTQNPVAKQALLLTQDAVIAKRAAEEKILDLPLYGVIRQFIKENPKLIYRGDNSVEQEVDRLPVISNAEELNTLENGQTKIHVSPSLKSLIPNVQVEPIEIEEQSCIIYLGVGAYNVDLGRLGNIYGQPRFVRRHVYGLERIGDNLNQKVMIAIQSTVTSIQLEYITFDIKLQSSDENIAREIDVNLYLQPIQDQTLKFSLFIVSAVKDNAVLDLLRSLMNIQVNISALE
jgi:predicted NAD-dependent protein-ADP-ribosyltransferase YbiA (DUF1768 family)